MASRHSASIHQLNSDYPLGILNKYLYLLVNIIVAYLPSRLPKKLARYKFSPSEEVISKAISEEDSPISPSRLLSNSFWNSLNWDLINEILKNDLRVAEIGCGSGRYGGRLNTLSPLSSYLGIDLFQSENWQGFQDNFTFVQDSYENFSSHVTDQNLLITQSAIEHFDKDLILFRDINSYAEKCAYPVIAIHVFPSAFCIYTFLWHGIRQYGFYSIRRILKSSPNSSSQALFSLGGKHSNRFHLRRITFPSVFQNIPLSQHPAEQYFSDLLSALSRDSLDPSKRSAAFYALILTWNTSNVASSELNTLRK